MKKRLQKMLAPNSVMFYVLFFLFAVVGLYFSRVYGAAGIVVCIILRIVSLLYCLQILPDYLAGVILPVIFQ